LYIRIIIKTKTNIMELQNYIKIYLNWETKDLFDQLYFLQEQTYTTINQYRIVAIQSVIKSR
jgi:hypothetical protein